MELLIDFGFWILDFGFAIAPGKAIVAKIFFVKNQLLKRSIGSNR
jgi:hypothetical protein